MTQPSDGVVDLRSDTVTRPSPAMRRAMADAEVGDDWFGDDPTVHRLQDRAAELTGREAALFLPTGTLCNQIALHLAGHPGHLVVCERRAHVATMELSSAAVLSGLAYRTLDGGPDGRLTADAVAAALAPDPYDTTVVDLVSIENTHQVGGGAVLPLAEVRAIRAACRDAGVPLHLDGARIFNACAATGTPVAEYAAEVDTMMFCLSKGLGAPIGSMLVGDAEFIRAARRARIVLGAAWRQAGILAAAGLVALSDGPGRLAEDHARARTLATGVADLLPGAVHPDQVPTNIVLVDVSHTGRTVTDWAAGLAAEGVLATIVDGRIRMVTHRDVDDADIDTALTAWRHLAAR